VSENHTSDDGTGVDPKYRSFDPPEHPSLRNPRTNPRGVRHVDETAQDRMAVEDRPRVQAAQGRRATMIAAAKRRLRTLSPRRNAVDPGENLDARSALQV
jgi:hypothetical protein